MIKNKKISLKQKVILISSGLLVVILSIGIFEVVLYFKRGPVPQEPEPPQFYYQYIEPHEPFFIKTRLANGEVVYKVQRSTDSDDKLLENLWFPARKKKNVRRIFVVGESVGESVGRGDFLKRLLEDLIPGIKFEVICCARGGYDSDSIILVVKEIINYQPDLIIILSGNNELFPIVHFNRLQLCKFKLNKILERLWLSRIIRTYFSLDKKPQTYIQLTLEERLNRYKNNLQEMVRLAKKRDISVVLCNLAFSFKDTAPWGFPPWQDRQFFLSYFFLEKGRLQQAFEGFKEFLVLHPEEPFGHYFLAQCYEALKDYPQSQRHYLQAINSDCALGIENRFLPPVQREAIVCQLSAQEDVALADLQQTFIKIAPNGLAGMNLFVDEVHWYHDYNSLIEAEIVQSIIRYNKKHSRAIFTTLDRWQLERCPDDIDCYEKYDIFRTRTDADDRALSVVANGLSRKIGDIGERQNDYVHESFISYLKAAYYLSPNIFVEKDYLIENLCKKFSKSLGTQAYGSNLGNLEPMLLTHIGEMFRRLKLFSNAIENFNQAISLDPDLCYAYIGRGLAQYEMGLTGAAKKDLEKASRLSAGHPLVKYYREILEI